MYTLPNVLNKLTEIKNIKQNISNALVNQGQNMTNTSFENFPEKVDNLRCNLTYVRFNNLFQVSFDKELQIFNTSLFTSTYCMFYSCYNLINAPNFDTSNVTNMFYMFADCRNLVNMPQFNTINVTNISQMARDCNNLSNESIQNIINMCLNSNIPNNMKNLNNTNMYSPIAYTIFNNSYYQNRWTELTQGGWTY